MCSPVWEHHIQMSKKDLGKWVLSFSCVCPRDWTQVFDLELGNWCLYVLNNLISATDMILIFGIYVSFQYYHNPRADSMTKRKISLHSPSHNSPPDRQNSLQCIVPLIWHPSAYWRVCQIWILTFIVFSDHFHAQYCPQNMGCQVTIIAYKKSGRKKLLSYLESVNMYILRKLVARDK